MPLMPRPTDLARWTVFASTMLRLGCSFSPPPLSLSAFVGPSVWKSAARPTTDIRSPAVAAAGRPPPFMVAHSVLPGLEAGGSLGSCGPGSGGGGGGGSNLRRRSDDRYRGPSDRRKGGNSAGAGVSKKRVRTQEDQRRRIKSMFRRARDLERTGQWRRASAALREILELDPRDSHSHLALARLEARRERGRGPREEGGGGAAADASGTTGEGKADAARETFRRGTELCPGSVHLWQAWALHEQARGDSAKARRLFERALRIDPANPYACHAFGLMERRAGNARRARELWERALRRRTTAALVCSLGELHVSEGRTGAARELFSRHVTRLTSERELTEVYLAHAWLEERHYGDMDRAAELLRTATKISPGNSRAQIALARLEGRRATLGGGGARGRNDALRRQLAEACTKNRIGEGGRGSDVRDGRLFNAWAKLEVRAGRIHAARTILRKGIKAFPRDHSLLQAAGKVEERSGNLTAARDLYSQSLLVEPSAPTLVAYALLELRHPESSEKPDLPMVTGLFEEALLLDPRHGPAYNAYGNTLLGMGRVKEAREVYGRGIRAECRDPASVHHGLARLELSLGNVAAAREILTRGLGEVERLESVMDNRKRGRAAHLAHTLGTLELNSGRVRAARSAFDAGLARHGNSSQLLLGAALCEVRSGNEASARELFERAVDADRGHAQAWQAWGVMEMRAGNYKTAKTLFECGIKSAPTHGALWQAYATMESRGGNFDVARTIFAAGVLKCPHHVPLYQAWACLEARGGNYDRARILISEALTRDKSHGSSWLVAAKIEEKRGQEGVAGLILQRGLECDPNDAELYRALAEMEVRLGKIDGARTLLEKGLEVDPLHAPTYHSLAELEARIFNVEGLARLNKRAAEVFSADALASPAGPASRTADAAWGKKIRAGRSNHARLPDGVAALAEEIGLDDGEDLGSSLTGMDTDSIIEGMSRIDVDDGDALGGMLQ